MVSAVRPPSVCRPCARLCPVLPVFVRSCSSSDILPCINLVSRIRDPVDADTGVFRSSSNASYNASAVSRWAMDSLVAPCPPSQVRYLNVSVTCLPGS